MSFFANRLLQDRRFALFGLFLCLEHLLVWIFWNWTHPAKTIAADPLYPLPWPHLEFFTGLLASGLDLFLTGYLLTALLAIAVSIFIVRGKAGRILALVSWSLLLLLNFLKLIVIFSDFRFAGNYHSMASLVSFAFLLIPNPDRTIHILLVLFYFFAGVLKLNPLWLSGAQVTLVPLPEILLKLGSWYVVLLELVLIFFLFSPSKRLRVFVLFQLLLFHLLSAPSVGWFYPSIMLLLLGSFLLLARKNTGWKSWALISFVLAAQLPQYLIAGEAAVTGEGRTWALIMYDGETECHVDYFLRFEKNHVVNLNDPQFFNIPRTKCDPYLYFRAAEKICEQNLKSPGFIEMDWILLSRSKNWKSFRPVVNFKDFCRQGTGYSAFTSNPWIAKNPEMTYDFQNATPKALPARLENLVLFEKTNSEVTRFAIDPQKKVLFTGNEQEEILWSMELGNPFTSIAYQTAFQDRFLIMVTTDLQIFSFERSSGKLRWKIHLGGSMVEKPLIESSALKLRYSDFGNPDEISEVRLNLETGDWIRF